MKKETVEPKQVVCPNRLTCEMSARCHHSQDHKRDKECRKGHSCPGCQVTPLTPGDARDIDSIMHEELDITPYAKVALRLKARGITSEKMWWFQKIYEGKYMPAPWTDGVYNQLRDLELGLKPVKDNLL